jgi:hypothetical protein
MAFTSRYLEPVSHSNSRTEFVLFNSGEKMIFPNMRLLKMGCSAKKADGTAENNAQFIYNGGIQNVIRNITLYSDGIVLDQLRNADRWLAFKNLNESAAGLQALTAYLNGSNMAMDHDDYFVNLDVVNTNSNDVVGRMELGRVLPILQQIEGLPGVRDLRLVIEYNTLIADVYAAEATLPSSFTVNRPLLVYEELEGSNAKREMMKRLQAKPVVWRAIENERLYLSAIADAEKVVVDRRLKGFDGKRINRAVMMVDNITSSNPLLGHKRSTAMPDEKINMTVNGKQLLQFSGVDTVNRKLATLDSWGQYNVINGTQFVDISGGTDTGYASELVQKLNGQLSYCNFNINQAISDLQIKYERTGNALLADSLEALHLYIFAEIPKFLRFDKNLQVGYTQ